MIRRIERTDFMSHVHTVIEPAEGLTVLVGPNNCGKSAVVAALQILCRNDNSTSVLRHGERECSVKVETDDGHTSEWRRKNAPSYAIDGELFDRLRGSGQPEKLHEVLRLPPVDDAGQALGFQILMISHHDVSIFERYADKIYQFTPAADGSVEEVRQVGAAAPEEDGGT